MMQGDSYNLGFTVLNNAKVPVTPNDIQDMEITIGHIRKTYRNAQIRILWANGVIEGQKIHGVRFEESTSKEVLQ